MITTSLHEIDPHGDARHSELSDRYTRFCYPGFGRQMHAFGLDVSYIRAEGDRLWYQDDQGVECEVLDLVGGYGVCLFGHNPADLVATAQQTLQHNPANMAQASVRGSAAEVGRRLSELAEERWHEPYCTALFNTGSDAIEAALKHCRLIRQSQIDRQLDQILLSASQLIRRHQPQSITIDTRHVPRFPGVYFDSSVTFLQAIDSYNRAIVSQPPTLLALRHAYHGLTPGALSLTDCLAFRRPFADLTLPTQFIDPSAEALAAVLAGTQRLVARLEFRQGAWVLIPEAVSGVLALFVEPIQGEAGMVEVRGQSLAVMVRLCRRNGIPVVADEVQSGMGRTGRLFAWEHTSAPAPDLIVLGKALGGGLAKVAAVMSRQAVTHDDFGLLHASTFAEDEIGSRLALAVIERLTAERGAALRLIEQRGAAWLCLLQSLSNEYSDVIAEVRGRGLMLGLVFRDQRNAGSDLMRVICTQGDFGYFIAGFLLREFGVRVAPTLNDPQVIRIEPSLLAAEPELRQAGAALRKLCEALRLHDLGALCRHLTHPALDEPLIVEDYRLDPRERMQTGALVPERVAFLGHFIDPTYLSRHEPSLSRFSPDQLDVLIRRTWDSVRPCPLVRRDIRSSFGHAVGFHFIGLLVTSEILLELLRRHEVDRARRLIRESVEVARDHGCRLVGFGQFTSIVTRNCKELVVPGVGFTSGNALTTGMALQALREVLKRKGKSLKDMHVAVIGAGGNIGSTFARLLADEARVLTLVGGTGQDSRSRVEQTAGTILLDQSRQLRLGLTIGPSGERLRVLLPPSRLPQRAEADPAEILREGGTVWRNLQTHFTSTDPLRLGSIDDCRQADVIVTATNATRPVLHNDLVGRGAVICDISIPSAVTAEVRARDDVTVFQGGVVALPHGERLNIGGLPLEPGLVYACMAETILLGLERRWDDYSVGDISKEQVLEITTIAERNGFRLARIKEETAL